MRLAGLLYDRINLETLPEVQAGALGELAALLADPAFLSSLSTTPPDNSLPLHMVAIALLPAHTLAVPQQPPAANGGGPGAGSGAGRAGGAGGDAEAAQRVGGGTEEWACMCLWGGGRCVQACQCA